MYGQSIDIFVLFCFDFCNENLCKNKNVKKERKYKKDLLLAYCLFNSKNNYN